MEARFEIAEVHSGIVVEGRSGFEEGHFEIGVGAYSEIVVVHFGIEVGYFEMGEVDHFGTAEVDRSGTGKAVQFESSVEGRFENWEGRSGIEAEMLAHWAVEIAVAVESLGRSGMQEAQAD